MSELSLMEKFSDPSLIHSLTFGEKMAGSLLTMLMGMGVTFIVLILLWGVILVMTKISSAAEKKASSPQMQAAPVAAALPAAGPSAAASLPVIANANEELVAIITAAISAFEADQGGENKLVVRKISRISGQATSWNNAGRSDCIDSRRF